MAGGIRAQLGRLGRRGVRARREQRPSRAVPPLSLDDDESFEDLAERLDIGAMAVMVSPRYAWDLDTDDVPGLLASVAHHAPHRGLAAHVQLPGRCLPLTPELVPARIDDVSGHPRFRVLLAGGGDRLVENIAVERWKQASRAFRSISDEHPVRLSISDAAPPREPAHTEATFDEPVDVVYTWVDSRDPAWRELAAPYLDLDALDDDLYTPGDELRYSLRSVEVFAPWVRRIHVLSNCAPPLWFAPSERIRWVDHREVAEPELLPLFNSGAIDTLLHRVPELSEHFLYLNDDFLLWDSVTPGSFFTHGGRSIARLATNSSVLYLQQLVEAGRAAPSQHSRVNAARLLEERTGTFHTRVHGHVPYALRRSRLQQMERDFVAEVAATRASRTRQPGDVSFIAYLYHHVGHAEGAVDYADAPASFITLQNYQRRGAVSALRQAPFVCFQDSRGSASDPAYAAFRRNALEAALPLPSAAERDG